MTFSPLPQSLQSFLTTLISFALYTQMGPCVELSVHVVYSSLFTSHVL